MIIANTVILLMQRGGWGYLEGWGGGQNVAVFVYSFMSSVMYCMMYLYNVTIMCMYFSSLWSPGRLAGVLRPLMDIKNQTETETKPVFKGK